MATKVCQPCAMRDLRAIFGCPVQKKQSPLKKQFRGEVDVAAVKHRHEFESIYKEVVALGTAVLPETPFNAFVK